MPARNKIILDTDPGVDDVLAILLAFAATAEEVEVLLISLVAGNIDVQNCLRNTISLFHAVENELTWRKGMGKEPGFDALRSTKPIVAIGASEPLADQIMMADYFHGRDGLGGIHETHPHLTPAESWRHLFGTGDQTGSPEDAAVVQELAKRERLFTPSQEPAHQEMLRLLRENEKDTITIVAIGPLTNLALAAAEDPETFLRVKEVVVMGGTINETGNITPVAEFNFFADSVAAARVFALSGQCPNSTLPPAPPAPPGQQSTKPPPPFLQSYPENLSRKLNVTIFPLDITTPHKITRGQIESTVAPLVLAGSPLAEWVSAFLVSTLNKIEKLSEGASGAAVGLELHDPLCVWYALTKETADWKVKVAEDVRVETSGQWTRGMCVVDKRSRRKRDITDTRGEIPGDTGNWLSMHASNQINRCIGSPGEDTFAPYLLKKVFQ